jgi:acetate kinase
MGLHLDVRLNADTRGECCISTGDSKVEVWVIPTNEEIVVARQTVSAVSRDST